MENILFDENLIKITEYEVLGELPDPFIFDNGNAVRSASDWEKRRHEIYNTVIEEQYGTMPPKPDFLDVETLYIGGKGHSNTYKITTGTKKNPISFTMLVFLPNTEKLCPAIIDGDLCFGYAFEDGFITSATDNGVAFVLFNRTELAHDINNEGRSKGALYKTYPEYSFGAIGAWAWGYSRCVDALEKLDIIDMSCIAFTGHSRGGKTAMLAGALDERAAIVNPNETCAGACSCYRIHMSAICEDGVERRSERLSDLGTNFPFWMGPELLNYLNDEASLKFDSHYLKAMVAPRILFVSEAASDIWANPIGSYQTTIAAAEVFKFLNAESNLYWYYRRGTHYHKIEDLMQLINIIKHRTEEVPINDRFFRLPFPKPEPIFNWRCP